MFQMIREARTKFLSLGKLLYIKGTSYRHLLLSAIVPYYFPSVLMKAIYYLSCLIVALFGLLVNGLLVWQSLIARNRVSQTLYSSRVRVSQTLFRGLCWSTRDHPLRCVQVYGE